MLWAHCRWKFQDRIISFVCLRIICLKNIYAPTNLSLSLSLILNYCFLILIFGLSAVPNVLDPATTCSSKNQGNVWCSCFYAPSCCLSMRQSNPKSRKRGHDIGFSTPLSFYFRNRALHFECRCYQRDFIGERYVRYKHSKCMSYFLSRSCRDFVCRD